MKEFEQLALEVYKAFLDEGSSLAAAEVIKEFMEDRCDGCERIYPEDAYEHVLDNPPDPPYMLMTVGQLKSLKDVEDAAKVLLRRATE